MKSCRLCVVKNVTVNEEGAKLGKATAAFGGDSGHTPPTDFAKPPIS